MIGSLQVPYIYEDRISQADFTKTLKEALNLSASKYKKMSIQGVNHVREKYNFKNFEKQWVETMDRIIADHGAWETRQGYNRWHLMEVA